MTPRKDRLRELLKELKYVRSRKEALYGKGDTPESRGLLENLSAMSADLREEALILLIEEILT